MLSLIGFPAMLYVFLGSDTFSLQEALAELKAELDKDGMLQSNTVVLDARQVTPQEVMTACDTVPFLSQHRLVIVYGALRRGDGGGRPRGRRGGQPGAGAWGVLAEYVPRMPPSTTLVLVDEEAEPGNPLLEALRPRARIRYFRPPALGAVPGWIGRRAQALGLRLTKEAVGLLAELLGNNLWALSRELEKLAAYGAGGQVVGEEEVRALVSAAREVSVFPLIDAIVEGRPAQALRLLRRLLRQEKGVPYLLAMIQRQYRHLIITQELLRTGATSRQIGERLGISGHGLKRLLQQAPGCSLEGLKAACGRILEADLSIKRGIYSEELALELLVQELAAQQRGRQRRAEQVSR